MIKDESFNTDRILIIKPSAIGDIANTLPFLEGIRTRFPNATIGWLVNQSYESLLKNHPAIHRLFPFDRNAWKKGIFKGLLSFRNTVRKIRAFRPTLTIDLQGLLRTGIFSRLSGAPVRIGLEDCREGSRLFYTHIVNYSNPGELHAVERYWEAARYLGCEGDVPAGRFPFEGGDLAPFDNSMLPRPWIGCCPGARWKTKQWREEYFASVINRAHSLTGGSVIFFGGPDDQTSASNIANLLPTSIPKMDFTGKTSLSGLVQLISKLDLAFSNDTGPLHIAVAQGIPVISPFLCTRIIWNGPFGQFANALETTVPCKGSYLMTCKQMVCLDDLTPDKFDPILLRVCNPWRKESS